MTLIELQLLGSWFVGAACMRKSIEGTVVKIRTTRVRDKLFYSFQLDVAHKPFHVKSHITAAMTQCGDLVCIDVDENQRVYKNSFRNRSFLGSNMFSRY